MKKIILITFLLGLLSIVYSIPVQAAGKYAIYVNRATRNVNIYKNGNWYKGFSCTIGKPSTPTITGTFYTGASNFSFGKTGKYLVKYATVIKGNYCFHTYLYDYSGKYVIDGRLGMALSHGCIRLHPTNAKFICSLPKGTKVKIL